MASVEPPIGIFMFRNDAGEEVRVSWVSGTPEHGLVATDVVPVGKATREYGQVVKRMPASKRLPRGKNLIRLLCR